jgi:hypothetical protein
VLLLLLPWQHYKDSRNIAVQSLVSASSRFWQTNQSLFYDKQVLQYQNSPLPLIFKERKKRTARSSPKFVYRQIFYPG